MSEPRRPPPPKSYVPLDLSTGPPKLPPRPTAADAGPPPNYTPPPPPLSDEEEEAAEGEGGRASPSKSHPMPSVPDHPKPQTLTEMQTPPTPQDGLRPPPSRPARPPTANTPSPDPHIKPSSPIAPPRARRRAATTSSAKASPRPPANSTAIKEGRPDIKIVSTQVMEGDVIPVPTRRPPPAPARPDPPPTSPPSATSISQSPRVPVRKAPTRPPPLKKAPNSTPPQPARMRESHDGKESSPVDGTAPAAPPRRTQEEKRKPPLRKSHTLPSKPAPPPQSPTGERATQHKPAPPKPSPYRAITRPPAPKPYKPSEKKSPVQSDSVDEKDGRESPSDSGSGIRIISSRRTKPQAKERAKPVHKEMSEVEENDAVSQTLAAEGTTPETKGGTEMGGAGQTLPPQAKERTRLNAKQANMDQTLQPQATESTKVVDTQERGTETEVTQERPPPPKPRRGFQTEGEKSASPEAPPQARPRTVSASRPSPLPDPLPQTREPPRTPPARPGVDLPGTSPTFSAAGKPSRPPPPASPSGTPPLKQKPTAPVTAQAPKAKRRSQLEPVEEKGSIHVPAPSVTQPPTASPRNTAGEEGSELQASKKDVVKQPQRRPEKPPPPKVLRRGQTLPHQTSSSSTQKRSSLPRKPPPPRQVPERGTVKVVEDRQDAQPDTSSEVAIPQRKSAQTSQTPPPSQPQSGGTVGDGEGVVNPPVARRRSTAEEKKSSTEMSRKRNEEHTTPPPEKEEEEEKAPQAVKRQPKRRSPMVLRPAHNEVSSEDKPSPTTEPKVTVNGSPKPAEPLAGQQEVKQLLSEESITTEDTSLNSTKETPVEGLQNALQGGSEPNNSCKKEDDVEGAVQLPTIAGQSVPEPQLEASTGNTVPEPQPEASTGNTVPEPQPEASTGNTVLEPQPEASTGNTVPEPQPEASTGNTTVMEKTEESAGVVLRGARAADTSDIRPRSRPKPARPMSMPPGRPGKPPKPAAPPARPPGQTKPPKPVQGPSRPAHGPTRPGYGPSRPPLSKARTPPVDPSGTPSLPPRPAAGHVLYRYVCVEPHGIALTNHEPSDPAELAYDMGDVIELIERIDKNWFFARNADLGMVEGAIPARDMRIVKGLPGQSTVAGFEEGPCAVAMHSFSGESSDELSFKEGDLIMLKSWVGKEWLRGKLVNGQEGIFPKNYVEIVEELPADAVEGVPSIVEIQGPHCVALYEFAAASSDELSFSVGDTVELLGRVGDEWLRGRLRGREGIFPSQFVEIREDLPAERDDGLSKTLYDFDGQEGELSFKAGALVKVLSRVNDEWVEGQMAGKTGMFPASFVDHLPSDLPKKAATTEATQVEVTGKCEALFDFKAENSGELSFKTGDTIVTLEWVNEEWISGRLGDQEGMFPVAFVKVLKELPKPAANKPNKGLSHVTKLDDSLLPRAEALHDFTAADGQRLSFKTGDILNLLEKIDSDWYSGENARTGSFGDFPASSVKVVVPLP